MRLCVALVFCLNEIYKRDLNLLIAFRLIFMCFFVLLYFIFLYVCVRLCYYLSTLGSNKRFRVYEFIEQNSNDRLLRLNRKRWNEL